MFAVCPSLAPKLPLFKGQLWCNILRCSATTGVKRLLRWIWLEQLGSFLQTWREYRQWEDTFPRSLRVTWSCTSHDRGVSAFHTLLGKSEALRCSVLAVDSQGLTFLSISPSQHTPFSLYLYARRIFKILFYVSALDSYLEICIINLNQDVIFFTIKRKNYISKEQLMNLWMPVIGKQLSSCMGRL